MLALNDLLTAAVEEASRVDIIDDRYWTDEEIAFLRENAGVLYDVDLADALGRTVTAIKVRRTRERLAAPRYHEDFVTVNVAGQMLNVDPHKVTWWVESGLIPGEVYQKQGTEDGTNCASGKYIRRIRLITLKRWCTRPLHWIYFDPMNVADPALKSLLIRAVARWGDEWWTVRQLCDYHNIDNTRWVGQKLHRGEIPGVQAYNLGGRHPDPAWSYWFIRKSDAIRARFITGKGNAQRVRAAEQTWSSRADAWLLRARDMGMTQRDIAARMGPKWNERRVSYRLMLLNAQSE